MSLAEGGHLPSLAQLWPAGLSWSDRCPRVCVAAQRSHTTLPDAGFLWRILPPLHHILSTVKSSYSLPWYRVMRAPVTAGTGWVAEWADLTDQSHAVSRD